MLVGLFALALNAPARHAANNNRQPPLLHARCLHTQLNVPASAAAVLCCCRSIPPGVPCTQHSCHWRLARRERGPHPPAGALGTALPELYLSTASCCSEVVQFVQPCVFCCGLRVALLPRVVRATAACAPISSHPQPCAPLPFAAMAAGPPTNRHSQPSACSAFCCHHCQVRERRLLDQRPPLSAVPAMPFLVGVGRLTVRAWPIVEQMVGAGLAVCAVAISACPRALFVAVASGRLLCILHRQACVLL